METSTITMELLRTRGPIGQVSVPAKAGVYAVFVKHAGALPLQGVPSNGLIYAGMSTDLSAREYDAHFSDANTGWSTLRRSLGALLTEHLNLSAIPRGDGRSDKDCQHFRFSRDGERCLTEWMVLNLEIGYCVVQEGWKDAEDDVISELKPVLCLKGWRNPSGASVRAARRRCVDEARSHRG